MAQLVRYMTWANRRDCLDAALVMVAEMKLPTMPILLKKRHDRMLAKLAELKVKLEKQRADAHRDGLTTEEDLVGAQQFFKEKTCEVEPTTMHGQEQLKVRMGMALL